MKVNATLRYNGDSYDNSSNAISESISVNVVGLSNINVTSFNSDHFRVSVGFDNADSVVPYGISNIVGYRFNSVSAYVENDSKEITIRLEDTDSYWGKHYIIISLDAYSGGVSQRFINKLWNELNAVIKNYTGSTIEEHLKSGKEEYQRRQEQYDKEFVTISGDYPDYIIDKAQKILNNLNFVGDAIEVDRDGVSVRVKDKKSGMQFWLDFWLNNGELDWDWNQYIFTLTDDDDLIRKALQENSAFAESAWSVAEDYALNSGDLIYNSNTDKYEIADSDPAYL